MLPGFRFLFAAIVFSISVLVFGLGAAALLRSAHERFAGNSSWRAPPVSAFLQPRETTPVLAALRVEPTEAEEKPATDPAIPIEPAAMTSNPVEAGNIATPEQPSAPKTAEPEPPALESAVQSGASAVPQDASASTDETKVASIEPAPPVTEASSTPLRQETENSAATPERREQPSAPEMAEPAPSAQESPVQNEAAAIPPASSTSTDETKVASIEQAPPVTEASQAPLAQTDTPPQPDAGTTKIAMLVDSAHAVEPTIVAAAPAKTSRAKPNKSVIRKRLLAKRARERRRLAERARLAQLEAQRQAHQRWVNPFGVTR